MVMLLNLNDETSNTAPAIWSFTYNYETYNLNYDFSM